MNDIIIRTHSDHTVRLDVDPTRTLAQALFLAGLLTDVPLCSGLGKCGLCRVRFLSEPPPPLPEERKKLSPADMDEGWRLSCLHPALACEIYLPEPVRAARPSQSTPEASTSGALDLALDLGTTGWQWAALADGEIVAKGRELNPQLGLGGEIMARLAFARTPGGAETLRQLAASRIEAIARSLPSLPHRLCVAGNPAMIYLLLDEDTSGIEAAPYSLGYRGGTDRAVSSSLPPAYVPPLWAPFVGADISAGYAAVLRAHDPGYPFLIADLGTNGEFVLALSPGELLVASVPMGPALEGVGLSFGRTAGPGVAATFTLTPNGPRPERISGDAPPGSPGMTGTAYLSLAALLRKSDLLAEDGRFKTDDPSPLAARLVKALDVSGPEPKFLLPDGMHLSASDLEEILKVKAAFNLALSRLLSEAGLTPANLKALFLAGALGEHVAISDLSVLGFLPPGLEGVVRKVGNASLAGAGLLLTDPDVRPRLEKLAAPRALDLAGDESFLTAYLERMVFKHVS